MKTEISKITAILVISSLLIQVYFIGWGRGSQYYNLKLVNNWTKIIDNDFQILVKKYPDLEQVQIVAFTGGNGCVGIFIGGNFEKKSIIALNAWLLKKHPPRAYYYRLDGKVYPKVQKIEGKWLPIESDRKKE